VFATNKLGSKYHSFFQYHNWRKALKLAGPDAMWPGPMATGPAMLMAGPMRQKATTDPAGCTDSPNSRIRPGEII